MYDEMTGKLMPSRVKALTNIIADYEAEQVRVCAKFPTCMTDWPVATQECEGGGDAAQKGRTSSMSSRRPQLDHSFRVALPSTS
jgi:hypothetical protein